MKKIKINAIIDKDNSSIRTNLRRYSIFLTWGTKNLFKDKKKAAKYQVKLNLWINDIFYELNYVYANLLFQYRRSWIFMDADIDDKMRNNIKDIEITMHRLFRTGLKGTDGIFWALEEINKLCTELEKCCLDLSEYYKRKGYYEHLKEVHISTKELKRILRDLHESFDPEDLGQALRRND